MYNCPFVFKSLIFSYIQQVYRDRNVVAQLVRRAERAGFKAIALTVDTPRLGRREADIKNRYCHTVDYLSTCEVKLDRLYTTYRFTLPPFLTLKNFEGLDLGKMDKVCNNRISS